MKMIKVTKNPTSYVLMAEDLNVCMAFNVMMVVPTTTERAHVTLWREGIFIGHVSDDEAVQAREQFTALGGCIEPLQTEVVV
jgi:hypothetical protein